MTLSNIGATTRPCGEEVMVDPCAATSRLTTTRYIMVQVAALELSIKILNNCTFQIITNKTTSSTVERDKTRLTKVGFA